MQKKITPISVIISTFLLGSILWMPFFSYADTNRNPIANAGVETASSSDATIPEHWNKGFWGTNDAVFSYPALGGDSTKATKVEITSYTSGDAKWFFDDVPVSPGEEYTFTASYLATVPADVVVRYTLRNGSYHYEYLGTSIVSAEWTGYATLPFTAPKDANSLTVFHLIREIGQLSLDNVSLRHSQTAPQTTQSEERVILSNEGGAVPLSYITNIEENPRLTLSPDPAPIQTSEKDISIPTPPIIEALQKAVTEMTTPLTYTDEPQTVSSEKESLPQKSFGQAIVSLKTPSGDFSDSTMIFLGLSLIFVSLAIPALTLYQNNEAKREEQLWEP